MSTRAVASAVFPLPIEVVWNNIRDFTFPARLIPTIESCTTEDHKSSDSVGAVRVTKWKSGETRKDKLLELSDQYQRLTWEMIDSEPVAEVTAQITTLKLHRITENNQTLVEWSSDFSSDTKSDLIMFNQKAFLENLKDMRNTLVSKSTK